MKRKEFEKVIKLAHSNQASKGSQSRNAMDIMMTKLLLEVLPDEATPETEADFRKNFPHLDEWLTKLESRKGWEKQLDEIIGFIKKTR